MNYNLEDDHCECFKVISADNLAKKDIFGASDPYVRIDLVRIVMIYDQHFYDIDSSSQICSLLVQVPIGRPN